MWFSQQPDQAWQCMLSWQGMTNAGVVVRLTRVSPRFSHNWSACPGRRAPVLQAYLHGNHQLHCCRALAVTAVAGKQLLSVWDRLCSLLRARQVSVEDVSNKNGMLLRVLHTAAFGTTW